jgi:hypothetical protein
MGEPRDLAIAYEPTEEGDGLEDPAEFLDEDPELEATCRALDQVLDQSIESVEKIDSEDDLGRRFGDLLNGHIDSANITALSRYIHENPSERLPIVEDLVAQALESGQTIGLAVFFVLSNQGDRGNRNMGERLVKQLALRYLDDPKLLGQIKYLSWVNHQEGNLLVHFILDFVTDYEESYQNINWNKQFLPSCQDNFYNFFAHRVADEAVPSCNNYLVESHFRDMIDSGNQDTPREGKLAGMPGGGTDPLVFTFDHIGESYENRLALGINEGFPIANPVLRIAPNLFGYYKNGHLRKVFSGQDYRAEDITQREAKYIGANNSADPMMEAIYEEVSRPTTQLDPRFTHQSNKLEALRPIWTLADHLESTGQDFFFDLRRIDTAELHPLVVGDMMTRNIELVRRTEGATNRARELSKEEFDKLLFPSGEEQPFALKTYNYLSSLGMRKKLERDFGLDLSKYSLFVQRNLLEFMAHLETSDTKRFKEFLELAGDDAIKSFVAMDTGLKDNYVDGDFILDLADRMGSECEQLFEKYSTIVDMVSNIEEFLQQQFNYDFSAPEIQSAVAGLLNKGRGILLDAYSSTQSPAEVVAKLQDYSTILLTISEALKAVRKSGAAIELEKIKSLSTERISGTEVTEVDRQKILLIARSNWSKAPDPSAPEAAIIRSTMQHLLPEVERGIEEGFSKSDNEFVIVKIQGEIVAFLRFDEVEGGTYFGSFNVDEDARGANLGRMICRKFVEEKAQEGRIFAHCSPMQDVSSYYISAEGGFVSRGIDTDSAGTGEAGFDLIRDDQINNRYEFSKKSREEIVALETEQAQSPTGVAILKHDHLNPEEYQDFLRESQEQYAQGKVMTAFFRYPKDSMVKYAVFEPVKSDSTQVG